MSQSGPGKPTSDDGFKDTADAPDDAIAQPSNPSWVDSGESDGALYYVSPFIPGGSLRDRLNREKKLPIDEYFTNDFLP